MSPQVFDALHAFNFLVLLVTCIFLYSGSVILILRYVEKRKLRQKHIDKQFRRMMKKEFSHERS